MVFRHVPEIRVGRSHSHTYDVTQLYREAGQNGPCVKRSRFSKPDNLKCMQNFFYIQLPSCACHSYLYDDIEARDIALMKLHV